MGLEGLPIQVGVLRQIVDDGFWPGVIHSVRGGPAPKSLVWQCEACEYAGCSICVVVAAAIIAVVVIIITKTRLVCFIFSIIYRTIIAVFIYIYFNFEIFAILSSDIIPR
jgi:hypothetical protein